MFKNKTISLIAAVIGVFALAAVARAGTAPLPDPAYDSALAPAKGEQKIVVSGGCFWGVQSVFQHVKGVTQATSGYAGGSSLTASYPIVSTGTTGHAESVEITYDPAQITTGQLLKVFFAVAHDPTELNYQGPDHGSQYRSEIFFTTPEQQKIADAYIAQLQQAHSFSQPIVTKVEPLKGFYAAEAYHQDYARLHPDNPYIAINDAPKVAALQREFPDLYVQP